MISLKVGIPRFVTSAELFVGKNSLLALSDLSAAKAVILVSPSIKADGKLMDTILKSINALDKCVITTPKGEPNLSKIQPIIAEVAEYAPDWIVAIGGGSVLDTAKLMWIFYEQPSATVEQLVRPFSLGKLRGKCRLVAVPTTAGTGSEVSSSTLFTTQDHGKKQAIVSHYLLPDIAILDPTLNENLPADVIAYSGLDALTHAIESYVSKYKNPFVDIHAEKATQIILETLPQLIDNPSNEDLRLKMLEASLMAGWAQNHKIPGIAHAVAHQMSTFNVPHGLACGQFLLGAIECNSHDASSKTRYQQLAEKSGLTNTEVLIERIQKILNHKVLKTHQTHFKNVLNSGINDHIPTIVQGAQKDICAKANPIPVNENNVKAVLESARLN